MGLLDAVFGGGNSGFDDARAANEQNRALYNQIALPKYSEFVPELYNNESSQYQLTADDPLVRSAQMSALAKMSGLADTGLSDADQAEFAQAANQAGQLARSNNAAVMNNAIARGQGGSGLEFLMREQANQDAAQRAQDSGMQTAANAARQRALYNQAFLQGQGQMRDQDYRTNSNNASIINQFNQANTQGRNQANQGNVNLQNQAFQYNQGLGDKNYQNQLTRADRMSGINNRNAEIGAAQDEQRRRNNAAIGGLIGAGIGGMAGGGWKGAGVGAGIGESIF